MAQSTLRSITNQPPSTNQDEEEEEDQNQPPSSQNQPSSHNIINQDDKNKEDEKEGGLVKCLLTIYQSQGIHGDQFNHLTIYHLILSSHFIGLFRGMNAKLLQTVLTSGSLSHHLPSHFSIF